MPYEKKTIAPLQGFAATPQGDYIQDSQASNMLNLRFDELGYLVNRNGVRAFETLPEGAPAYASVGKISSYTSIGEFILSAPVSTEMKYAPAPPSAVYPVPQEFESILNAAYYEAANGSTTDLGVYDRFMVYGARMGLGDITHETPTAAGTLGYILIPLSQMPDTRAEWNHQIEIDLLAPGKRSMAAIFIVPENPDGTRGSVLVAPGRRVSRTEDDNWVNESVGFVDDRNWIEHYQQMSQLRHKLVIADRRNGDLVIIDAWDETEPGREKEHFLRMRYNAKSLFDIDIVEVDYNLGAGDKNDPAVGVETGMALYKLYPDKRDTVEPFDGFDKDRADKIIGKKVLPEKVSSHAAFAGFNPNNEDYASYEFGYAVNTMVNNTGVFLRGYQGIVTDTDQENWRYCAWKLLQANKNTQYTYTNIAEKTRYDSILHKVSFTDESIPKEYNAKGELLNNNAADVYIWRELTLRYYPSYGSTTGVKLLRDRDREWGKITPIAPKVERLETKAGLAQDVPLGVWAYRFVWDFGGDEFSSPSTPIYVGDILWSATPDESMSVYSSPGRMVKYDGSGAESGTVTKDSVKGRFSPYLVTSGDTAANKRYTDNFTKVKAALYSNTHPFNTPNELTSHQVIITVFHPEDTMQCRGVAGELLTHELKVSQDWDAEDGDITFEQESRISDIALLKITVVLNRNIYDDNTLQPLFSKAPNTPERGTYRACLSQQSAPSNTAGLTTPPYQAPPPGTLGYTLVFPGESQVPSGFGILRDGSNTLFDTNSLQVMQGGTLRDSRLAYNFFTSIGTSINLTTETEITSSGQEGDFFGFQIARSGKDIYIAPTRAYAEDENGTLSPPKSSIMRLVDRQSDRLLNIMESVPPEVKDRILLQGQAELSVSKFGDSGVCLSENPSALGAADTGLFSDRVRTWEINGNGIINAARSVNDMNTATNVASHIMALVDSYNLVITFYSPDPVGDDNFGFGGRYIYNAKQLPAPDNRYIEDYTFDNLTVAIYLPGERLLLPEQLTAYFPSSLLFRSPRVSIKIPVSGLAGITPVYRIPPRAKKLLIFRTLASHDNNWQPEKFGFVSEYIIERNANGVPEPVNFFDDKRDDEIDFSHTPDEYDGIIYPLKSRFTRPLANLMWFANFEEQYQPYAPRGNKLIEAPTTGYGDLDRGNGTDQNAYTYVPIQEVLGTGHPRYNVAGTNLRGFDVEYFIVFRDLTGIYSPISKTANKIDFKAVADPNKPVVYIAMAGYPYTAAIDVCEIYRRRGDNTADFYKIGEIKATDEGVFVDDGTIADGKPWTQYDDQNEPISVPDIQNQSSAIAWSELGQPSWIRYDARQPINLGDGDIITGMEVLYGELIVFKERGIHRITLKNGSSQIGRIDQVANKYGCIAPNTIISYNNQVYFLSWHGLMRYDNNVFEKADGAFSYELDLRLKSRHRGLPNPAIRDASMCLNSAHRELYLNIPVYTEPGRGYDRHTGEVKGHIYVLNLDTGFVTKFQYETADTERFDYAQDPDYPTTRGTAPRTMGRIYHTNSYGQLWSADILPKNKVGTSVTRALHYLESPTTRDYDELQPGIMDMSSSTPGLPETDESIIQQKVNTWWRSKVFTADDKSIVKRVRSAIAYIMRGENPTIGAEYLNNEYIRNAYTEESYTTNGELTYIPPRREPGFDRGERVAFHVYNAGETEFQNFAFYFRPVNKWVR